MHLKNGISFGIKICFLFYRIKIAFYCHLFTLRQVCYHFSVCKYWPYKTLISEIRNIFVFHENIHINPYNQPDTHHYQLSARQCFHIPAIPKMVMFDQVVFLWYLIRPGWNAAIENVRHFVELRLSYLRFQFP